MTDELELELQNAAHTITVWAYSGSESRRRAVAELLADVMVAVEQDRMAEARDQMRRLLVMASWTEMSLDEVAEGWASTSTTGRPCWTKSRRAWCGRATTPSRPPRSPRSWRRTPSGRLTSSQRPSSPTPQPATQPLISGAASLWRFTPVRRYHGAAAALPTSGLWASGSREYSTRPAGAQRGAASVGLRAGPGRSGYARAGPVGLRAMAFATALRCASVSRGRSSAGSTRGAVGDLPHCRHAASPHIGSICPPQWPHAAATRPVVASWAACARVASASASRAAFSRAR